MPVWINDAASVVQLLLNGAAIAAGVAIRKLYIDELHATLAPMNATNETVEKGRDF